MKGKALADYTIEDVSALLRENVDAVFVADSDLNEYKSIVRKGMFEQFMDESGSYHDLIEKLWFHFGDTNERITEDYHVFVSSYGEFKGKYSRRLRIKLEGSDQLHMVQMSVFPLANPKQYLFIMDELGDNEYEEEYSTAKKVNTIQNTYLFSMYIDIVHDTTSSISISEISDDTVNASIKYSEWRMMIVNMIWPEDQEQFLRRTDPDYLKKNFTPGRTSSFDCMMRNLEGKYIWVKLIFSRAETSNEDDYRFVFMVQNIHENSIELLSTLKKYEKLALTDPLTGIFNHGGIETEIYNAINIRSKTEEPVSLMMLDIDFFKKVNDTYGHAVGDMTLKQFTAIIKEEMSKEKAAVGRWGGEEFVVVCYGKNGNDLYDMAEELRTKVEKHEFPEIGQVTCSIGVTEMKAGEEFKELFERLDKAMYASKENGRNMVTIL
ncbi:MAG: GGDEF domain-containing protein [Lachnospiraceae bacterium]|nr:GGDEF domain-containing protein [Lachnospiraceae bacterium]